jgi:hypothetical protein
LIGISDDLNCLQVLSGAGSVSIIRESTHDFQVNFLHAEFLKEILCCLNRLGNIVLESTDLILESKAETLNSRESFECVKRYQSGVKICRLILSSRVKVDECIDFVDH